MDFRHYSPEQQISLYKHAITLRKERGWGKQRIAKALGLSNDTVKGWIYRGYSTLNKFNNFDSKPSYELGYVIGSVLGDGNLYFDKTCGTRGGYLIRLKVKDLDFINEFNKCVCIILNKKKPYAVAPQKKGLYIVKCSCKNMYEFLNQPLTNQKSTIEGTTESIIGFIRGFFDAEGGCYYANKIVKSYPKVRCYNTDIELLEYVKHLLSNFDIYSAERTLYIQGQYGNRKALHELEICRHNDIIKYHTHIGFSIKRKQERLEEIVKWIESRKYHGNRK